MIRIAVLGAELEGLMTAWVLSQHPDVQVDVIDTKHAATTSDDLPALVHTPSVGRLLGALGVPFTGYVPKVGVLLRERIHRWPRYLRSMPKMEAQRIMLDLTAKVSRTLDVLPVEQAKIPRHRPAPQRVRFDVRDLRSALWPAMKIRRGEWAVSDTREILGRRYDRVVLTAPLWRARERVPVRLPNVTTARRTLVTVAPRATPQVMQWDTVHLPYTPHGRAVRSTVVGSTLAVEFTGAVSWADVVGELNYICRAGCEVVEFRDELPGVPFPSANLPDWPAWLVPLGTYATWRTTALDAVLDRAYDLLRAWTKEEP